LVCDDGEGGAAIVKAIKPVRVSAMGRKYRSEKFRDYKANGKLKQSDCHH